MCIGRQAFTLKLQKQKKGTKSWLYLGALPDESYSFGPVSSVFQCPWWGALTGLSAATHSINSVAYNKKFIMLIQGPGNGRAAETSRFSTRAVYSKHCLA